MLKDETGKQSTYKHRQRGLQRAHEEPRIGRAGGVTPGYCKDKEGEVLEGPDVSRDVALGGPHETAISAPGVGDQQPPQTSSARLGAGPRSPLAVAGRSHWVHHPRVRQGYGSIPDFAACPWLGQQKTCEGQQSKVAS